MAYEQKDNSGSLFTQTVGKENMPNFKGSAKVNGVEYWVSGWNKTTKDGKGWISLSLQDKDSVSQKGLEQAKKAVEKPLESAWDDSSDSIPF